MAKKLPKYNSLKLFNRLAKEVRAELKSQGKELTWNEAQKYTSKNVFQDFKGLDSSKLKDSDLKNKVSKKLSKKKKPTKKDDSCFNVFSIPEATLFADQWWGLNEILEVLDGNTQIRINSGSLGGVSSIDKINNLSIDDELRPHIEEARKISNNKSGVCSWEGVIKKATKTTGGTCDFYIDFILMVDGSPIDPSDEQEFEPLPTSEEDKKRLAEKLAELSKKKAKQKGKPTKAELQKQAKQRKRPTDVETPEKKAPEKPISKETSGRTVVFDINKELDNLREDFKLGIFTVEEFKEERRRILDMFKKGGIV